VQLGYLGDIVGKVRKGKGENEMENYELRGEYN
jgi:hypothetical protein